MKRRRNRADSPRDTVIVGFSWAELDVRPRDVDFELAELADRISRLRDEVALWRSRADTDVVYARPSVPTTADILEDLLQEV